MLIKESPPEDKKDWAEVLTPLMNDPEEWYRVASYPNPKTAYNVAYFLRDGAYRKPNGVWEFRGAKVAEDEGAVYARYMGDAA